MTPPRSRLAVRARASVFAAALLATACGGGGDAGSGGGDLAPPQVSLDAPANLARDLVGTLAVQASARDDASSVDSAEFELDGAPLARLAQPPYSTTLDTALHASGQHVLRVRATDRAGNTSAWTSATVHFGGSRSQPAGFTRNAAWVSGLASATAFAQAPDGRWFVAQQGGALRVVRADGTLLAQPFVSLVVESAGERGLLGIAFDPQFASNGHVYLYHTVRNATAVRNRVSRFTAQGDVALAGSEVVLLDLPPLSSATNHNGGALHFGPDGMLYVAVGENAQPARAQDLGDPFGKILRIARDGSVPADNPFFATQAGLGRAVWAYGLRNPYTFAFDAASGAMMINDVGAAAWEEVNAGERGANYGWPASEGPAGVPAGARAPVFAYAHAPASPPGSGAGGFFTGSAIVGGAFYPAAGPFPAAYRRHYYFADFGSRFVARMPLDGQNTAYAFGMTSGLPVGLEVGADGALYVLTRSGIERFSAP